MEKPNGISTKIEGNVLTITAGNQGTIVVDAGKLPIEVQDYAKMHGLKQTVIDTAALAKGSSMFEKYQAMKSRADQLMVSWRKDPVAAAAVARSLIVEAMGRIYKLEAAQVEAMLSKHEEAAVQKLASQPAVAEMIAKIRAEKNPEAQKLVGDIMAEFKAAAAKK